MTSKAIELEVLKLLSFNGRWADGGCIPPSMLELQKLDILSSLFCLLFFKDKPSKDPKLVLEKNEAFIAGCDQIDDPYQPPAISHQFFAQKREKLSFSQRK